jgi:VIT1/CCC1 family predicted Fe2+/Mn2+ transporter
LQSEEVQRIAKQNLEKGERWHKKLGIKEIVFGFQDNSIAILAVLAGVIGGSLQRGQILLAGLAAVIAGAISVAIGDYVSSKSEVEYFEAEISRARDDYVRKEQTLAHYDVLARRIRHAVDRKRSESWYRSYSRTLE